MAETHHQINYGRLEMIIGPMFSGKTTELIRRIRFAKLIGKRVLVISHCIDTRYSKDNTIISHDAIQETCVKVDKLSQIAPMQSYKDANMIFIEEAQFFEDLDDFTRTCVERDGKSVVLSALDGDYMRRPFQHVVNLIPFAENVRKMNAICMKCRDGTLASFSKRLVNGGTILVGGVNEYMSVCRKHFIDST
jgi:thymidine kinase